MRSRLFTKVRYYGCAPMHGKSRLYIVKIIIRCNCLLAEYEVTTLLVRGGEGNFPLDFYSSQAEKILSPLTRNVVCTLSYANMNNQLRHLRIWTIDMKTTFSVHWSASNLNKQTWIDQFNLIFTFFI